jgi:type I restriction-modification system DNA methylase subunit
MESNRPKSKQKSQSEADRDKPQSLPVVQLKLSPYPHRNQQLFSDHYLNNIGPSRPDWLGLAIEASDVMGDLRQLFERYTPSDKEAQVEEDFIKPVLRRLGHTFEVQASLSTPDGSKTPDYVFYRDQERLIANKKKKLNDTLLAGQAIAVGDAKAWDRPLDVSLKSVGGDPFTNKNPSYQIAFYMQQSGLDWGILTNGRLWRLYHKDTAHKLDRFYEVNLPEMLESGDVNNFLYFYAFFRRQAFDPGDLSIEALRQASLEYARGVSNSLKTQVYEALRHVAQGFLDYRQNLLQSDPQTLKQIYDSSLILLYRLLFILYAESRDLLPIHENQNYGEYYSLDHIKRTIQQNLKMGRALVPNATILWAQLKQLFQIIDEGNRALGVTTFNGGLFNPERHPFLEHHSVGDLHLQQAIDKLARVDGQFVDYRDLAERHLGTIYEGLLEFHIEETMDTPEAGWTIDLKNEKGERKITGSYYTPDYIVKYMVEETLGPVLQQAVARAKSEQEKIQAVLNVKVLDPAMGSGHFPVEATDYIARFLVEHIEQSATETGGESELAFWRRRVAQSCIYGIDLNPLAVDLAQLSLWLVTVAKDRPLSFLDHHLRCGNSLVGARLAELREDTGVAKKNGKKHKALSPNAPHTDITQPMLFDEESLRQVMTTAVDLMWMIEVNPAQTIDEVKEQEQTYKEIRRQLTDKYSRLANIVSATHFGITVDQTLWKPLSDYATGRISIAPAQFAAWLDEASVVADTLHFFHWELEFPEVFFNRYGQHKGDAAGFDVVIGNPPYVRQEKLGTFKPYFATKYPETYDGVADLYIYFYQQGLHLTRVGGRMSYIVTNKWMRSGYGQSLRAFFAQTGALERIVDFGHAPIFEDADVFPCILVLSKPEPEESQALPSDRQVQVLNFPREELNRIVQKKQSLQGYIQERSYHLPHSRFTGSAWHLEGSEVNDLLAKIQRVGIPLTDFSGVKPYRGVLTGLNEAFLIDTPTKNRLVREDPRSAEVIKPYLRGQDIKRWSPEWAGLWMIFARRGIDIDAYPVLKNHLLQFREQLEPKPKDWTGGNWSGRKPGSYRWYEIQDAVDYWTLFEQPKIMYQEIQSYPAYCMDSSNLFSNNKVFFLAHPDRYLLAVLNSPLMWWHNWRYLPHMMNDTLTPVGELMESLPIASPPDNIRAETEQAVAKLIEMKRTSYEAHQLLLDWLETEFEVQEPGKRLSYVVDLDLQAFVDEVRKRRSRTAKKLTPAALKALRDGYTEQITPLQQEKAEVGVLERKMSDLVNCAYGLAPDETALLWETAPPHMPLPSPPTLTGRSG